MYIVYVGLQGYIDVSLQALQLSSTLLTEVIRIRQAGVGLPTPFSLLNICALPGCLYIW